VLIKSRDRTRYSFFCVKSILDNFCITVFVAHFQYSHLKLSYQRSKSKWKFVYIVPTLPSWYVCFRDNEIYKTVAKKHGPRRGTQGTLALFWWGRLLGKNPVGKSESTCVGKINIDFKEAVCGQGNEKLCSVIWGGGGVISRISEELLASHGGMWYME